MTRGWLDAWPPLPPAALTRSAAEVLPFPLEESGCRIYQLGRHALWHGIAALGLTAGDEVLVPAFHHGSEIEALSAAGIGCRFYDCGPDLAPDPSELTRLLGPRVRALHVIHYLGFPQDGPRWRQWCDERGLLLFEDAAQAWLTRFGGRPVGSFGDLAIFSLYKTFGLPDGGALICRVPPSSQALTHARGLGQAAGLARQWVDQKRAGPPPRDERDSTSSAYDPLADFALGDPLQGPSLATSFLLPRLADPAAAAGRRAAYELLLESLGSEVPPPFDRPAPGVSPFAFPIETDDKPGLVARLAKQGIGALNLWTVPHPSLPEGEFPAAAARRARTVGLPVHQELRRADLERIACAVKPRARSTQGGLTLDPVDDLEDVREEWSALAATGDNVFATWEWASAWWRHLGEHARLATIACRRGGELRAVLPLYLRQAGPLRELRFLGDGPADQLGPVCAPTGRLAAARALRRALQASSPRWDLFVGQALPGDEGWEMLLDGQRVERDSSPVLDVEAGGWEAYLASRSANLRQQIRRRERNLARRHQLSYRLAEDPDRLAEDMDTLLALHRARWGGDSEAFAGARWAFHRQWAAVALERGWLRLWFLELDGRPVAAWYGFRFGGSEWFYQSGRDPGHGDGAVGFVLLAHTIRAALDDGLTRYRFLLGAEPYKARFASHDPGLQTVAVARGARGRSALAARVARPVAGRLRRWVGTAVRGPATP